MPAWAPLAAMISAFVLATIAYLLIAAGIEAGGGNVTTGGPPGLVISATLVQDVALVAAAAALNHGPSAGAQGKIDEWEALVAYAKDASPEPYQRVALRAAAPQPVFVHLRNALAVPRANVSVKLVRLGPRAAVVVG